MIYLSGKITGLEREDYLSIFKTHEEIIKKMLPNEKAINPALTMDTLPTLEYSQYMDLAMKLLAMCDTIYLIPGWEDSLGAKRELEFALSKSYEIIVGEAV